MNFAVPTSKADRLAAAIVDTIGDDDETAIAWAEGVCELGTEIEQLREALSVCVDRLTHGALDGNAQWWDLARPLLIGHCAGQPAGEPSCDEKITYWINRHREACEQLEAARAELRKQEAVMVAADRMHEAYSAMLDGAEIGRLPDWQRSITGVPETREGAP